MGTMTVAHVAGASTPTTCVSEASTAREIGAPGTGCKRIGTEKRMSRARLKAASRVGVQSNSLIGPLRALVRNYSGTNACHGGTFDSN